MARSMWSGAISFGLVNVPVKLYSSVSRKTVRFHQLNGKTGHRISQKRVDSVTNEEVPYEGSTFGELRALARKKISKPTPRRPLIPGFIVAVLPFTRAPPSR